MFLAVTGWVFEKVDAEREFGAQDGSWEGEEEKAGLVWGAIGLYCALASELPAKMAARGVLPG